ncbi:MAG: ABC transporter ATP-binding protein [Planctomycetes bacterium]|nr:ABC transporter ATP-binding protein [Planctomycetota bacterium]
MTNDPNILLQAKEIRKSYQLGRETLHVLRGGTLTVKKGQFVAIMGASGSGKSTLLHILGLLDRPDEGQVFFDGQEMFSQSQAVQNRIRNSQIGFVFQFYHLLPELTLEENVRLPAMVAESVWSWSRHKAEIKERTREVIRAVGLEDRAKQWPATLSGGERQRTALARALIQNPRLLLADEPTGNLDSDSGKAILNLLTQLNRSGQTIIMVTHDAEIARLADRRLLLHEGKLKELE